MNRVLFVLLAALVLVGAIFALWPGMDLAEARWFHDSGGFVGSGVGAQSLRWFFRVSPFVVLAAYIIGWSLRRAGVATPFAPSGRQTLFLIATIAIGPGLIVNLGMKDHLHRPRPTQTAGLGGRDEFKPWYSFDGGCAKNCSFPSGEAASGFWMVAPALLAPPPWRGPAVAAAIAFGVAASALRLAFGGHYLSDVLFGGLISLFVVFAARRLFWPEAPP